MKIKSNSVPKHNQYRLTNGKVYSVDVKSTFLDGSFCGKIIDDTGESCFIVSFNDAQINNNAWEVLA